MKRHAIHATIGSLVLAALASTSGARLAAGQSAASSLDFEFFKTRIQPIFVAKRPGHARCISCHIAGTPLRLQPFSSGGTTWTDEESRKNFEAVRRVVLPGVVQKSRLLVHPLAEKAGGDFYHSGGKHWDSQNDPEWRTLRAWVLGETKTGSEQR
jgi:hypothetical protein